MVGVGDAAHGDDGAGPFVAKTLEQAGVPNVINSGAAPELDTWRIREIGPDSVLFVDAVDFGGKPGEVAFLKPSDLSSAGFDTHRAPLRFTMKYLEDDLGCCCLLLAIQPKDVRYGLPMCEEVRASALQIAEMLKTIVVSESQADCGSF